MRYIVRDYEEFIKIVESFSLDSPELLIVQGNPGSGKSTIIRNSLRDKESTDYAWIAGRTSAVMLYETAYDYQDFPLYIDDADSLCSDREAIGLLKHLCQTEKEKTVQWLTKRKLSEGVPSAFSTTSKVCIITNRWENISKHVGAVTDRALLLTFNPSAEQIHAYAVVNRIINDYEIFDFFNSHIAQIKNPSLRHYVNAQKLKNMGLDWKEICKQSFGVSSDEEIVLSLSHEFLTENEKAERFSIETGKSPRTYYRIKRILREHGLL